MKRINKKICAILITLCLLLQVNITGINTYAADASITIALSSSSISIGKSVTATVSVKGASIAGYEMYISYDSSVLQFTSGSGTVNGSGGTLKASGSGAGSFTVTFKAVGNGSCRITTSGSEFYDINTSTLSVSHAGATVKVETAGATTQDKTTEKTTQKTTEVEDPSNDTTTETTEDDSLSKNCNLKSMQVSPGTLTPAFSKSKTSYTVQLDKDATSIVVSAAVEDEKSKTSISGAKSLKPGENKVKVTVTAENGAVKVYKINVICGEVLGDAVCTINGEEFSFIADANLPEVPEGFTNTTVKYKDWEVVAYQSPNGELDIVPLSDTDGNTFWYILDKDSSELTPYVEYSAAFVRYILLPKPENVKLPAGYTETKADFGNGEVTAYAKNKESGIYLLYAMNVEGSTGLCYYDSKEKTFMRYADLEAEEEMPATVNDATVTDTVPVAPVVTEPKKKESKAMLVLFIIALILFLCMCVVAIILATMNRKLKDEIEFGEPYDANEFLKNKQKVTLPETAAEEPEYEEAVSEYAADATPEFPDDTTEYAPEYTDDTTEYAPEYTDDTTEYAEPEYTDDIAEYAEPEYTEPEYTDDTTEYAEPEYTDASTEYEDSSAEYLDDSETKEPEEQEYADGIILEDADNNPEPAFVPNYKEEVRNPVEDAMKSRPYGIDSAFDVVPETEADIPAAGEKGPKIELPNQRIEDEFEE